MPDQEKSITIDRRTWSREADPLLTNVTTSVDDSNDLDRTGKKAYQVNGYRIIFGHEAEYMLQLWTRERLEQFLLDLDHEYVDPIVQPVSPAAAVEYDWPGRKFFYEKFDPHLYVSVNPTQRKFSWQAPWTFTMAEMEAFVQGLRLWVDDIEAGGVGLPIFVEIEDLAKGSVVAEGRMSGLQENEEVVDMTSVRNRTVSTY